VSVEEGVGSPLAEAWALCTSNMTKGLMLFVLAARLCSRRRCRPFHVSAPKPAASRMRIPPTVGKATAEEASVANCGLLHRQGLLKSCTCDLRMVIWAAIIMQPVLTYYGVKPSDVRPCTCAAHVSAALLVLSKNASLRSAGMLDVAVLRTWTYTSWQLSGNGLVICIDYLNVPGHCSTEPIPILHGLHSNCIIDAITYRQSSRTESMFKAVQSLQA
jgi:hypothetical protein